jgi:hypothetical protein
VIEHPTFIIGPEEFLTKVEYFVKEFRQSEQSEGDHGSLLATKRSVSETQPTDPNEIDLFESPMKHPRLIGEGSEEEDGGRPQELKKITSLMEIPSEGEGDEEEEECGDEFIKELELLQSQDISSLQQLIVSMENQIS